MISLAAHIISQQKLLTMETTKKILDQMWHRLIPMRDLPVDKHLAFTGFDGFVDNIHQVVHKEEGDKTVYFNAMPRFADHLQSMGSRGGSLETVARRKKIGGNAPVLSNTMATLGIQTHCLGAMGYPKIHPVFLKMHKLVEITSVIEPGENQVLEFRDAKLVLSEQNVFESYNWEYVKTHTGVFDQLQRIVTNTRLFALVDWANLPHASDIWEGFLNDMIRTTGKKDALFFFHLGDPYKMTRKKIGKTIELINQFAPHGKVTVSLNESEALRLWLVLNGHEPLYDLANAEVPPLEDVARFIFRVFDIDAVILRHPERTFVATEEKVFDIRGRRVERPRLLSGGGDNFDAGYCLGLLEGMDSQQCALLGIAASGAYIQNGYSPCVEDLIEYLKSWADELAVRRPRAAKKTGLGKKPVAVKG